MSLVTLVIVTRMATYISWRVPMTSLMSLATGYQLASWKRCWQIIQILQNVP